MTKDQEHIVPEFPDSFALRSPRLWATWYDGYMTVPEDSVYRAIDALRTSVAEWDTFVGDDPADQASRARVADAAQTLADLMEAMARHAREGGLRELVQHIMAFLHDHDARAYLDALRTQLEREKPSESLRANPYWSDGRSPTSGLLYSQVDEAADLVDALIALYEKRSVGRGHHTA